MQAEYAKLHDYVVAAVKAAWPTYTVNPDQPQRKVQTGYAVALLAGVELTNVNGTFDDATFTWDVSGYHPYPPSGTVDDKVVQLGSDLRFALLAATTPADTGNMPMVTEHERVGAMEEETDGAFVTRTRFTVGAWVPRSPA